MAEALPIPRTRAGRELQLSIEAICRLYERLNRTNTGYEIQASPVGDPRDPWTYRILLYRNGERVAGISSMLAGIIHTFTLDGYDGCTCVYDDFRVDDYVSRHTDHEGKIRDRIDYDRLQADIMRHIDSVANGKEEDGR